MKKIIETFLIVVLFCSALIVAGQCLAEAAGLRYSVAVANFENRSTWHGQWSLQEALRAVLVDSLNQTGRFIVLGEEDMRKGVMEEQDFALSGRAAGGGRKVVTGQMTPAQLFIKGKITHFSDETAGGGGGIGIKRFRVGVKGSMAEINMVLYIVDSSTGQVMASKKCYGKITKKGLSLAFRSGDFDGNVGGFKKTNAGKAMEKAADEGVAFLISKLEEIPWTGAVVLCKGNKVFINRGEREGVGIGQAFNVGKITVLRDPDTGEMLDQEIETLGTIQVVKVKRKISICKITNGAGIKKGMTVSLPEK